MFSKSTGRFKCPVCRDKAQVFTNTPLSAVVEALGSFGKIDCKNCDQKISPSAIQGHLESICVDRNYTCPACSYGTRPSQYLEHFKSCLQFNYVMPLIIMNLENADCQYKYCWNLHFLNQQQPMFCLIIATQDEYLNPKYDLKLLPHHFWVRVYEDKDIIWLEVRLTKSYHFTTDMKCNINEEKIRPFKFKVSSDTRTQLFDFPGCEDTVCKKAILTRDSLSSSFSVTDIYELQFSFETILWLKIKQISFIVQNTMYINFNMGLLST
jgi:hypothetical protein